MASPFVLTACVCGLLGTSLASVRAVAQSPTNAPSPAGTPAIRFSVGSPQISGAFMLPYQSQWREWEIAADGTRRETARYSDELRFETLDGREVIRNVQHRIGGTDGLVILLDRKTLMPLWTEDRDDKDGSFVRTVYHKDRVEMTCAGSECPRVFQSSSAADTVRKTTPISEPVFDFFAGSFGLLLAALPLSDGLVATVPVYHHGAGFFAMEVRVGAAEAADAGAGRKVAAWPVTVPGTRYLFHVSKEAPHWIRMIINRPDGTKQLYDR